MTIGLHSSLGGFDKDLIDDLIAAGCPIFLGVGDHSHLQVMKDLHAGLGDACVFGFRNMYGEPWIEAAKGFGDPVATAKGWLDDIGAMVAPYEPDPLKRLQIVSEQYGFIYWQALNEQKGDWNWQGKFDKARVELGLKYGIKIGVCAAGWGQPEPGDWLAYEPALKAVHDAGPLIARVILHIYYPPPAPNPNDMVIFQRWRVLEQFLRERGWDDVADNIVVFEFGRDEPGFLHEPVLAPAAYVDQLVYADSLSPHIRKAVYDCSGLPGENGQPNWYTVQDNVIISKKPFVVVRPVDLLIQVMRDQPRYPYVYNTTGTTPVKITINNPDMELPDDTFGMPAVPTGWVFGYNPKRNPVNSEMERHPTHVGSGRQSARMWGVGDWQGVYTQNFKTVPGATYTVMVDSLATVTDVVDAPSLGDVTQTLLVGPHDDEAGAKLIKVKNHDKWTKLSVEYVALTELTAIVYQAYNPNQRRADAFIDNVRVIMIPAAQNPLEVLPLPAPVAVTVAGASGYLRMRSTPVLLDPPDNEVGRLPNDHRFFVNGKTRDGKWLRDESGAFVWASLVKGI